MSILADVFTLLDSYDNPSSMEPIGLSRGSNRITDGLRINGSFKSITGPIADIVIRYQ